MHSPFVNRRAAIAAANARDTISKFQHGTPARGGAGIACHQPRHQRERPESAEDYPRIVAVLDPKTRVIECAAGIQWIVQVRKRVTEYPWEGVSFCRTRGALVRLVGSHPALLALPDRFPESGHGR
jgi:hypothetical protein